MYITGLDRLTTTQVPAISLALLGTPSAAAIQRRNRSGELQQDSHVTVVRMQPSTGISSSDPRQHHLECHCVTFTVSPRKMIRLVKQVAAENLRFQSSFDNAEALRRKLGSTEEVT